MNQSSPKPDSQQEDLSSSSSKNEPGKNPSQPDAHASESEDAAEQSIPTDDFSDQKMQTWTPPRGPVVKLIAWLILAMIGLGILAMIWGIAQNLY